MFYLNTDKNDNIIGISLLTKPVKSDGEHVYMMEPESIPDKVFDNLSLYKYNGSSFIKMDEETMINQHINTYKRIKLSNMSRICNMMIINGIDYNGKHYSLSEEDQLNLSRLSIEAKSDNNQIMVYHADGESARVYDCQEIIDISYKANTWINYNTIYYNLLKQYINGLESSADVESISYFQPLPEIYNDELNGLVDITEFPDLPIRIVRDTYDYSTIIPIVNARPTIEMYKQQRQKQMDENASRNNFNNPSGKYPKRPE